jgi:hypothetical protein
MPDSLEGGQPIAAGVDEPPYRVERNHDERWEVIGPDGSALGTSYGTEENAEDMARHMSWAYQLERVWRSGRAA